MFHICSISYTGIKNYCLGMDGNKVQWASLADAERQIACFNVTSTYIGCFSSAPKNFKWIIEPA